MIAAGPPEPGALEALLAALEAESRLEHGFTLLRQARPDPAHWGAFLELLRAAVAKGRARRMNLWQIDPRRRTLRLRFEVRGPACAVHPAGQVALLARTLMAAGLPVAMGLEKKPRPAVRLGHPLPLNVEGLGEWAEAVLEEAPAVPLEQLPAVINQHAPEGLRVLHCAVVANHASPVAELCCRSHWRWLCPPAQLEHARERMALFAAAERFEVDKPGKVDGQKGARRVDLRPLLQDLAWEGEVLTFQTRNAPGEATNPQKLLAGILGGEPGAIQGLTRVQVALKDDARALQGHKFEPKLHNMFEDAVLLESGSNIRIVDEDDDEAVLLG